ESLVASGEVAKGRFLISENDQYMLASDRKKLRTGKNNVYDYEAVENYRLSKGESFDSIEDFFKFYVTAGSEIDVYNRVKDFDLEEWQQMRRDGRILLGRFCRGRVRFILAEDAAKYAYFRVDSTESQDAELLRRIEGSGNGITLRELVAATGMDKDRAKEAVMRLDRSLRIIRAFGDREDWGTENYYVSYEPELPEENPCDEIVEKAIRAFGPVPTMAVRYLVSIPDEEIAASVRRIGAVQILVGPGQMPMYIMPDELPALESLSEPPSDVRVLSLFDPDLGSKWAEISARYGDRWIYPVTKGSRIIGAMEIWEMSGCLEVRSVDLDSPEMLSDVLTALDKFMEFYRQKGIEIIRIREILSVDAADLDGSVKDTLAQFGYVFINGFYAKGRFVSRVMTHDEALSYVFRKQRLEKTSRFGTFEELIAERGYVRSDQELPCRVAGRTSLKKQMELGTVVKTILCPTYVGYIDPARLPVLRTAKKVPLTGEQVALQKIVAAKQPISKKNLMF
ncbi:MAG: winged helix DNA-binding domain-containing protein, partial [Candidatus Methanomethylophilus sp.]|nr:winged helix DNA-binding domain-containing protein [Methanomethylophilus sp.]